MKKSFLHSYIISTFSAIFLLFSPSYAQSEARGLLKNLDSDYVAKNYTAQNKVMKKQQDVLIAEILKLKKQLKEKKLNENSIRVDSSELDLTKKRYEALKKALIDTKSKNSELASASDSLKVQNASLSKSLKVEKANSTQLLKKLEVLLSRVENVEQGYSKKLKSSNKNYEKKIEIYKAELLNKQNKIVSNGAEKDLVSKKLIDSNQQVEMLEKKYEALKKALESTSERANDSSQKNKKLNSSVQSLEKEIKLSKQEVSELKSTRTELAKLKIDFESAKSEIAQRKSYSENLNQEITKLKEIKKEYIILKNENMLKNSEPGLSINRTKNSNQRVGKSLDSSVNQNSVDRKKYEETRLAFEQAQKDLEGYTRADDGFSNSKESILTITGSKVNLRNGPGLKHSPIMQISKGAKLTIEAKEGEWYRVYTPTGSRAYVHQDVVEIGHKQAAKKVIRKSKKLIPFGSVKVAGRSSGRNAGRAVPSKVGTRSRRKVENKTVSTEAVSTEELAIKKLRTAMGLGGAK